MTAFEYVSARREGVQRKQETSENSLRIDDLKLQMMLMARHYQINHPEVSVNVLAPRENLEVVRRGIGTEWISNGGAELFSNYRDNHADEMCPLTVGAIDDLLKRAGITKTLH